MQRQSADGLCRRLICFQAVLRFDDLLGGSRRFDFGEQTGGAAALAAGTMAARMLAAMCSASWPAERSAIIEASTRPTSSAERGATCDICRGFANPLNGSSLVMLAEPLGRALMAF